MSAATFETFYPADPTVGRYVDYYYLDRKPGNEVTTFECFPHHNTTVSLYAAHRMPGVGRIDFDAAAPPLQVFTPLRDRVLRVRQTGPVHRVVIVFRALGIQQFWRDLSFTDYHTDHPFFSAEELSWLFATHDTAQLTERLDGYLKDRYIPRPTGLVTAAVEYIFAHPHRSVSELAEVLGASRRHLQRVFKATLGVPVKRFQQIVVLRGVIDRRLSETTADSLTQLAYAANYSDQAHMIRTFRQLTQNAPGQFFARGRLLGRADTFWHLLD